MVRLIFLGGFLFFTLFSYSQNIWSGYEHLMLPARNYVIYQTISEIEVDGKADEVSWEYAEWSEYFRDIEGDKKPEPLYKTRYKMLWDSENLYIFTEMEEPHVWAYYTKHDMVVFHENDIEVFIDPDKSTHNYYEFEVNAQNTLFDLFLPKPYRDGGQADIKWNAKGFKSAVFVDGTLNNPGDVDRKWTVEMVIPFSSLSVDENYLFPENGDIWKIGFSRVQWQTEIVDGRYTKKKDEQTNKNLPEDNWVWSPQGLINMHFPERWGMALFSGNPVNGDKEDFEKPVEEELNKYLWLIYYKQQHFRREYGVYSNSLSKLNIPPEGKLGNTTFQLELTTDVHKFTAILETENGMKLSINQYGLFQVMKRP